MCQGRKNKNYVLLHSTIWSPDSVKKLICKVYHTVRRTSNDDLLLSNVLSKCSIKEKSRYPTHNLCSFENFKKDNKKLTCTQSYAWVHDQMGSICGNHDTFRFERIGFDSDFSAFMKWIGEKISTRVNASENLSYIWSMPSNDMLRPKTVRISRSNFHYYSVHDKLPYLISVQPCQLTVYTVNIFGLWKQISPSLFLRLLLYLWYCRQRLLM